MPVQIIPPSPKALYNSIFGQQIGQGLAKLQNQQQQQQQQSQLANLLFGQEGAQQYGNLPVDAMLKAAQLQQASMAQGIKSQEAKQKEEQEKRESELLSKYVSGEKLSPQEKAELSPVSLRSMLQQEKPVYEPESEKLEAKRVSDLATEIENEYKGYLSEIPRISRMEKLSEKGELSTPLMVNTLNKLGLPLGILSNPDTEEFAKLEADFLRDVRALFPGRVTNYEIQAFLKGIPTLMNTAEGRKAIINNRKLMNEAKKVRYDAYKEILKENGGRKPQNMGIQIEERISDKLNDISEKFIEGMNKENEKFQQPIMMIDPKGRPVAIPPDKIEDALKAGAKFR